METGLTITMALVAGVLTSAHCVAMCGGFVLSYANAGRGYKRHALYGVGKVASYAVMGALFGALGRFVGVTNEARVTLTLFAGLLLLLYGATSLGLIPTLRVFKRLSGTLQRVGSTRHPLVLGLASGLFVVCGPLQAMYVVAAGTASATTGAALLAAYGLGTLPALVGLGITSHFIAKRFGRRLQQASAVVVIVLGFLMVNRAITIAKTKSDSCCAAPSTTQVEDCH